MKLRSSRLLPTKRRSGGSRRRPAFGLDARAGRVEDRVDRSPDQAAHRARVRWWRIDRGEGRHRIGGKAESDGAGGSVEVGSSHSVQSRTAASIRRVYRIEALAANVETHKWDANEGKLVRATTGMMRQELLGSRVDLEGLRLDDDDVGDEFDSLNADWILHSNG